MKPLSPFVALLTIALCALGATAAQAREYAPVDRPGPPLSPSAAQLRSSVSCDDDAATAANAPVLLTAGTEVTEQQDFGWNYIPALRRAGYPVCLVESPGVAASNTEDIQERAEYVVNAIRFAYQAGGNRRISIVGHSQGGMVMRWPLRFWPDTRALVADVVGFAPTNHGSALVPALCVPDCAPALWQQIDTSAFIDALNSGQETFAGISYTNVYTRLDEFVQPNLDDSGTSSLRTGDGRITNVALQDICPGNTSEHLLVGTADPVSYALTIDALTHDGPADPRRVDAATCSQTFMPGVDPARFAADFADAGGAVAIGLTTRPRVPAEPALKEYVLASYRGPLEAATAPAPAPAKACPASRRVRLARTIVRARQAGKALRIRRHVVTVRFAAGQRRATLRLTTRAGRTRTLIVKRC